MAVRVKTPTVALLKAVRQSLDMSAVEVGAAMGVGGKAVNWLERAEMRGAITMRGLARMADAMGCEMVYGIVPKGGRTMEALADMRMWQRVLDAEANVNREVAGEAGRA